MRDTFGLSLTPCSPLLKHARHMNKEPEGTREARLSCVLWTKRNWFLVDQLWGNTCRFPWFASGQSQRVAEANPLIRTIVLSSPSASIPKRSLSQFKRGRGLHCCQSGSCSLLASLQFSPPLSKARPSRDQLANDDIFFETHQVIRLSLYHCLCQDTRGLLEGRCRQEAIRIERRL